MFVFAKLKMYAAFIGAALLAVVTVYFRGRADGKQELEYEIKDDRLDKLMTAKKVQDDVQQLSDDDIVDLAREWVRREDR
mgnify:CR=1 FL=1